ncbi:MAG TPA: hypothetical protein VGX03_10305 [Candidatus Binatia bacterium]|jgi:hypothetical protein|nr:hypothetical protein [Candidatus Binatia bacterium]
MPEDPGSARPAETRKLAAIMFTDKEARAEVAELLRVSPNFSLEGVRRESTFKNPADLEKYLAALRKAGLK